MALRSGSASVLESVSGLLSAWGLVSVSVLGLGLGLALASALESGSEWGLPWELALASGSELAWVLRSEPASALVLVLVLVLARAAK